MVASTLYSAELCLRTTGLRVDEVVRFWNAPPELALQIVDGVIALVAEKGVAKPAVQEALLAASGRLIGLASSSWVTCFAGES